MNGARVRHLEIVGPFDPVQGPSLASLRKVYTCGHRHGGHGPGCLRRVVTDVGGQIDFRFGALSALDVTLSLGAAVAFERGAPPRHETMISLKILR